MKKKTFEEKSKYYKNAIEEKAKLTSAEDQGDKVSISYLDKISNEIKNIDAVLIAIGRRPNVDELNLGAAGVEVNNRGTIVVDKTLKTSAENIWALGDVKGGLQFTYISLDDFRIVKDNLFGEGTRSTEDRDIVPYSVFIEPTLSRVGLSKEEALNDLFSLI